MLSIETIRLFKSRNNLLTSFQHPEDLTAIMNSMEDPNNKENFVNMNPLEQFFYIKNPISCFVTGFTFNSRLRNQ